MTEYGVPSQTRQGMPLWGKIVLGCGVVSLLVLGSCVVGGYYVGKKIATKFKEEARRPYQDLQAAVADLKTPEGLKAFYDGHPGLRDRYPTVESFQAAAEGWKDRLGTLPSSMPDPVELIRKGGFHLEAKKVNGNDVLELRIRNQEKGWLVGTWENGQLVDFRAE